MIKDIKIHNIATYSNPLSIQPLKINFFYGSNGSGKTTLTNLLGGYEPSNECDVTWENGNSIPILVFNKKFVEVNFGESPTISGIFTLGQDTKDGKEFIAQKRAEIQGCLDSIDGYKRSMEKMQQEKAKLDNDIDDTCWAVQQRYGAKFSLALSGYRGSKRFFREKCLLEFPNMNETNPPAIKDIEDLYGIAFGETRETYPFVKELDTVNLDINEECILLSQRITGSSETPVGKFIEFLNNSDWVKQGISYTVITEGKCPYCQQSLPLIIQKDIEAFFDETYEKECADVRDFLRKYEAFTNLLLTQLKGITDNPNPLLDYELIKSEFDVLLASVDANKKNIQDKIESPSTIVSIASIEPILQRINKIIGSFNAEIKYNNDIVQNQVHEKKRCQILLWEYITYELKQPIYQYNKAYEGKSSGMKTVAEKIKEQNDKKGEYEKQIAEKEEILTSVAPTVNAINGILTRFGFDSFKLAENTKEIGTYKIIRPDGSSARKTLSEGEYNFITFLYFYHLVYGSQDKTGILTDKVVVIDDPISSLDSNVLFIISTLVRSLLKDCKDSIKGIRQIFLLTHNVYFHKEVTFLGSRQKYPMTMAAFWVIKKTNNVTEIIHHNDNPIQTSYELLWSELKDANHQSRVTIFNTLRRILEYYFNIIGGIDYEKCIDKFDGEDKILCRALISSINDGSHFISDDFVMCYELNTMESYLRVFKFIFEKMEHGSHYEMMMRQNITQPVIEMDVSNG